MAEWGRKRDGRALGLVRVARVVVCTTTRVRARHMRYYMNHQHKLALGVPSRRKGGDPPVASLNSQTQYSPSGARPIGRPAFAPPPHHGGPPRGERCVPDDSARSLMGRHWLWTEYVRATPGQEG